MHIWLCLLWGGKERMEQNKFETRFPKFCFANVKGHSEHWYFPFIVTEFHGILHHLKAHTKLVVLRCYRKNLEKWSCTIIEIKSIWFLKYFLLVFLFFFFNLSKLLFTIFWKHVYNLFFYSSLGYNNINLNSKIAPDIGHCKKLNLSTGRKVWFCFFFPCLAFLYFLLPPCGYVFFFSPGDQISNTETFFFTSF